MLLRLEEYKRINKLLETITNILRYSSGLLVVVLEDTISNSAVSLYSGSSYSLSSNSNNKETSGRSLIPTSIYYPSSPNSNNDITDNDNNNNDDKEESSKDSNNKESKESEDSDEEIED